MTCSSKKSPVFAAFWKIARPMSGKFSIPSTGIIADHDHAHCGVKEQWALVVRVVIEVRAGIETAIAN
jgi:hypothetical protein